MTWTEDTLVAMGAVPAATVLAEMEDVLRKHFGARRSRLLMVDYGLRRLLPVGGPWSGDVDGSEGWPVDGSDVGRTFASQQISIGPPDDTGVPVRLPVTVRGDRLGVLEVWLSEPPDEMQSGLRQVATALGHAISVASRDTDVFEQASRAQRLSVAAEMQWQLLPGRGCQGTHFFVAGHLEPAYYVAGDNFDWCADSSQLFVSVSEGMGRGTLASSLTGLAVNTLRNARRAGMSLGDQARLADETVYSHYGGAQFVSTVLVRVDHITGRATAVDAGSPLMLRQRGDEIMTIELEEQLPLGMFDRTNYVEQELPVIAGDRLVIVSDGVHAARSSRGEVFRERLERTLLATRVLHPGEVVRQLIRELLDHHEGGELADDAVVVCLDRSGPQ